MDGFIRSVELAPSGDEATPRAAGSHTPRLGGGVLLVRHPGPLIDELSDTGARQIDYEAAEPVRLTESLLRERARFLAALLEG